MNIVPFNFNGAEIRTVTKDGEPWFVAKDIALTLGIEWKGSDTTGHLDESEKGFCTVNTLGGEQQMLSVNESGLYALIFKSRKPEAVQFRKWVTSEVLPQIRKTGGYHMPKTMPEALRLLADQVEQNEKLQLVVQQQAPAVEYVERCVKSEGLFGIRETAKIMEMQQNAFVALCISKKVLFRENGSLQPYAQWIESGYFKVKTGEANEHAFKQTRFTGAGLVWVRKYLNVAALLGDSKEAA